MIRGGRKATAPFCYLAAASTAATVYVTAGVAAVTVYKDNSDDDKPYPVVVNEIAKTIIHKMPSFQILGERFFLPSFVIIIFKRA